MSDDLRSRRRAPATLGADFRRRDERLQPRRRAARPAAAVGSPARRRRRPRRPPSGGPQYDAPPPVPRTRRPQPHPRRCRRSGRGATTAPIDMRATPADRGRDGDRRRRRSGRTPGPADAPSPALDLAIETLVSTSQRGRDQMGLLQVEHRAVAELCEQTRSVAEVAALLSHPARGRPGACWATWRARHRDRAPDREQCRQHAGPRPDGKGVEWTPSALGQPVDRHRGDDLGQDRGGRGLRRRQDHVRRLGLRDRAADHRGRHDRGQRRCRRSRGHAEQEHHHGGDGLRPRVAGLPS